MLDVAPRALPRSRHEDIPKRTDSSLRDRIRRARANAVGFTQGAHGLQPGHNNHSYGFQSRNYHQRAA